MKITAFRGGLLAASHNTSFVGQCGLTEKLQIIEAEL
jgi:hypothetical protein